MLVELARHQPRVRAGRVRGLALRREREKGLVVAVIQLGNEHWAVDHEACLAELVITATGWRNGIGAARRAGIAEVLVRNILILVRVQIRVLKDVRRPVDLVRSISNDLSAKFSAGKL